MSYTIKLPHFEGPFDLLLFFIERDELDIYNIPIASITDDFLSYIRKMDSLNIDLASEFIVVAASLMRIKAKLLLPRREIDEAGNEIDPREELVQRLLEYKRYKSVLEELRQMEEHRALQEARGNAKGEIKSISTKALVDVELESVTLFKLMKSFQKIMERFEDANKQVVHQVVKYHFTVRSQKAYLLRQVAQYGKTRFETLFLECSNRVHAIFNFLALLELVQLQELDIDIREGINNFWVIPKASN